MSDSLKASSVSAENKIGWDILDFRKISSLCQETNYNVKAFITCTTL
jgi:hypothetical protein